MDAKRAAERLEVWGDMPCDHPTIDRLGQHTGLEVCVQCGRVITRDGAGRPIPSPGGR